MSSFEKLWFQSCVYEKILMETANAWFKRIQTKYSTESHRFYHNLNVINKKCDFLLSLRSDVQYSDYLVFAIVFQYFNFDLTTDCTESNITAFRDFYNSTGIDNVSCVHLCFKLRHMIWNCVDSSRPICLILCVICWAIQINNSLDMIRILNCSKIWI